MTPGEWLSSRGNSRRITSPDDYHPGDYIPGRFLVDKTFRPDYWRHRGALGVSSRRGVDYFKMFSLVSKESTKYY